MPNDMRDRLIELYDQTNDECDSKDCISCKYWNASYCREHKFIDKIIANGAIMPPCDFGDDIWIVNCYNGKPLGIIKDKVQMIGITSRGFHIKARDHHDHNKMYMLGKTVFLTREDAEKALREREGE